MFLKNKTKTDVEYITMVLEILHMTNFWLGMLFFNVDKVLLYAHLIPKGLPLFR